MKIDTNKNTPMHMPGGFTEAHHSKLGPVLALLFIVLVIILGGLYLWGGMLSKDVLLPAERTIENNEPETLRAQTDAEIMSTVSSSDSLEAIEADVESTNLDSLDAELQVMEQELESNL